MDDAPPPTPTQRPVQAPRRDAPAPTRRRSVWRWLIPLIIVLLIGGGIFWRLHQQPAPAARGFRSSGPLPVGVATVGTGKIDVTISALGTVTALATTNVVSQVTGQLSEIDFREGQEVKKGDLLAQIDPRPFQAALDQAVGQLAKDQALLKEAEIDLARYKTLASQNSIARQQAEDQEYVVEQDQGMVKVDEAAVSTARINLGYCRIVAPITGRIGLRMVDVGNVVQASSTTALAVMTQVQPITVVFALAEDNLPAVLKRLQGGAQLSVTAFDRSGTTKLATGTLAAIDSSINTSTGTVNLKAQFANDDEILFPNQFVNATLLVDSHPTALTMPTAATQRGAQGTFVYLVQGSGDAEKVAVRLVKLGTVDGEQVEIIDGLQAGDQVVVDGADKLRDGAAVVARNGAGGGGSGGGSGMGARQHGDGSGGGAGSGEHHRQHSDSDQPKTGQ